MNAPSLRVRLTIWYTLAVVSAVLLFGVNVLWSEARIGLRRVDRELASIDTDLVRAFSDHAGATVSVAAMAQQAVHAPASSEYSLAILDTGGVVLAERWKGPDLSAFAMALDKGARVETVETAAGAWRLHVERHAFGAATLTFLAASSLADVERAQHEVLEAMEVAIPLVLVLAGGGGLWLAAVGLRPITEMARQAASIGATSLDDLGHTERTDELGRLARAFNGLVSRLRHSLRTQQQFMADASHELRTPVSVIRAAAEVVLTRDARDESEYRETLAIVRDEARRLSRLVDHMLVLARADAGGHPLRLVDLYLNDVVADCCRTLQPLAMERSVSIEGGSWPDAPFRGDEDLLQQLVLNVLKNAVQHTPRGGRVGVNVSRSGERIEIRITDTGSGIALSDRSRIFDRFVRLDAARHGAGSGLGLPIARWIAEAHQGTLTLESSGPHGSTFLITFRSSGS